MKLYMVQHEPGAKRFLFCDGRRDGTYHITAGTMVLVETMRGITDGMVVSGPLCILDDQVPMACTMFGAYLPIMPILAVGKLADKHAPTRWSAPINLVEAFGEEEEA